MFAASSTTADGDYVLDEGRRRIHAGPERLVLVEGRGTHGALLRVLSSETATALLDTLAHRLLDLIGVASVQIQPPWPSLPARHRSETTMASFGVAGAERGAPTTTRDASPSASGCVLDAARYLLVSFKPPAQRC